MAALSNSESGQMYSWWWNSHISPKNSKWLQENLTDMDSKIKAMIKLIEEDADSFARRAEMYYKKRPDLMKLVEEFYRAYRALAERYGHATGVIRQAHQTMAEAFPNQVPSVLVDDSPTSSTSDADPRTPRMSTTPARALFEPDYLQKDTLKLSSSPSHVNVHSVDDDNFLNRPVSESESGFKSEKEILILKEAFAKLEAEKEAGLIQYQHCLERLSKLESDVSCVQENSRGLGENAWKAEADAQILKEALTKLEAEKEASLLQYQFCFEKICDLENIISHAKDDSTELNERASKAEIETRSIKEELGKVESEKDAALNQYQQSLDMISDLESRLLQAEENARKFNGHFDKAENEVETLMQAIAKLTEEKKASALQYQQCLETISRLQLKISCAEEKAQRLSDEIDNGVGKLKGAEERCLRLERSNQSIQSELETLELKIGTQSQELIEKQKDLGRLWTCIQEERFRFMEAETAFQTLQHLHSQAQEELRSLTSEVQNRAEILRDLETRNTSLQDEVLKVKEEKKWLNELNLSSAMSIKDMQKEIFSLRDIKGKLEEEVELRMDQRNDLQQEIYRLKEELNELNKKHQVMLDQVDAFGWNSECLGSSVKELQNENSNIKEICQKERCEKVALLEKLEILEQILEKNAILENSLCDLSAELEGVRRKIKGFEKSCQSLLEDKSTLVDEKATLIGQLKGTTENVEKLSEKNTVLENALSDAHVEFECFQAKSKSLEDSCQLFVNQTYGLINEKDALISQLEITRIRLEDLEKRYKELEEKYSALDKEKEVTLCKVEELQVSLDMEKQGYVNFAHLMEMLLADMESRILQEEGKRRKQGLEEELDKDLDDQIEIFIMQRCARDLEEKNFSLLIECQNFVESSKLSEKMISELEKLNLKQKMEVKSLFDQTNTLRIGMYQLLKALDIVLDERCEDTIEQDQTYLRLILSKVEDKNDSLRKTEEENQRLAIELSVLLTLLGELRLEAIHIQMGKNMIDQVFRIRTEEFAVLQGEALELIEMNEDMKLEARKGAQKEEVLTSQIQTLNGILLDLQGSFCNLQKGNSEVLAEGNNLLYQKETELVEAKQKLDVMENERAQMRKIMEHMKWESDKVKMIRDEQERYILKLSRDNDHLNNVNSCLCEASLTLEVELHQLRQEHEDNKTKEESLCSELQERKNEIEMWETRAEALFSELHISSICQALFKDKIYELNEAFESLEYENTAQYMDIKVLQEKVSIFETENEILKAQLAAYGPAVISLKDCMSTLEKHPSLNAKIQIYGNEEAKDTKSVTHRHVERHMVEDQTAMVPYAFSDLQHRIKCIEKTFVEMEQFAMQENLNMNTKLDAAMRRLEELKTETSLHRENANQKSEIIQTNNGLLTKDIMLDQISECSSQGTSKRELFEIDNQMLELWETADQNGNIDLTVGKGKKIVSASTEKDTNYHHFEAVKKQKSEYPTVDVLIEKELSVDKLELPKRSMENRRERNKSKILERLNSDIQKMTNLQITVQDLKGKLETTEKRARGKGIVECDNLKGQLEEAEETILKLFDVNGMLMKNIEDSSLSFHTKSALESEDSGNVKRRRISERARRISEKIGQLQLEVQKMQFVLLRLDDEKESKGRTRITETRRTILLKEYLYGRGRTIQKKKKAPFCACVKPPTKGG